MAGTLVANTINTDTGLFSTQNAYQGIAKAWVNFQGGYSGTTAGAINKSFNVSSVTYVGTGTYTVNFSTAMVDGNYSAQANSYFDGTSGGFNTITTVFGYTTTSCGIWAGYPSTLRNGTTVSVVIFD